MTFVLFDLLVIVSAAIMVLSVIRCLKNHGLNPFDKNRGTKVLTVSGSSVRIEVYYAALDDNSEVFITQQLIPTYDKLKESIDVILIPYGKTQIFRSYNGSHEIRCEHDPNQCEANLQHACVIDTVQDLWLKLHLIGCLSSYQYKLAPSEAFLKCSKEHQLPQSDLIQLCTKSDHGMELLKRNGKQTIAASKQNMQTPFVILNDSVEFEANRIRNLYDDVRKLFGMRGKLNELVHKQHVYVAP